MISLRGLFITPFLFCFALLSPAGVAMVGLQRKRSPPSAQSSRQLSPCRPHRHRGACALLPAHGRRMRLVVLALRILRRDSVSVNGASAPGRRVCGGAMSVILPDGAILRAKVPSHARDRAHLPSSRQGIDGRGDGRRLPLPPAGAYFGAGKIHFRVLGRLPVSARDAGAPACGVAHSHV